MPAANGHAPCAPHRSQSERQTTPKSTKMGSQILPKSTKMGVKILLDRSQEASWRALGRSWAQDGPKRAPRAKMYKKPKHFRPPLGGQVGAKIHQKSFQEPSKPHLNLHLVSDSLLHRILIDFFMISDPQNNKKTIKNHSTNHPNSTRSKNQKSVFRIGRASEFVPSAMLCCVQNSIKNGPRSIKKHLSNQHPNLHRFWNQLGSILGGFWEPSWSQVGTKWLQKSIPKTMKKSSPSGSLLGAIF